MTTLEAIKRLRDELKSKEPKADTMHNCEGSLPYGIHGPAIKYCRERPDGKLVSGNGEYESQIAFCPYCGYKANSLPEVNSDMQADYTAGEPVQF